MSPKKSSSVVTKDFDLIKSLLGIDICFCFLLACRFRRMFPSFISPCGGGAELQAFSILVKEHKPCLVPKKFCKIFQIPRHIESLDTCMEY